MHERHERKLKLTGDAFTDASVPAVVIVYWVKVVTVGAVTTYQLTRSNCTTGTATGSVVVIRSLSSVASVSAACTDDRLLDDGDEDEGGHRIGRLRVHGGRPVQVGNCMMRPRRLRGEGGASLVLALAFLTLFGVSSVALLSLTGVSSRNSKIQRDQVNQLYAADGGIETGIETLRTDEADGTVNTCKTIGETESLPATTINGKPVTVQCKTTKGGTTTELANGGGTALLKGYSAILGTGGLTVGGNTPNGAPMVAFSLGGQVYSGGAITTVARAPVQIGGDLGYYAPCPPLPPNVTLTAPAVCAQVAARRSRRRASSCPRRRPRHRWR